MIALYHGGSEVIKRPEIREPNRTLDFGKGFYLTSSKPQAEDWVSRRCQAVGTAFGYVNEYEFDLEAAASMLSVKTFDSPSDEWLDFVMANRRVLGFTHDYDIVVGPVANDRVYTAFSLYEGGTISRDILIQQLKTYKLVDQYLFHTPQALDHLIFRTAYKIGKND